jgi:hypothetical protein
MFVSFSVLVLDGSYIGVSYMLVDKMNEFVEQHNWSKPLHPYFTLVFEVDAWLLMIPAGISCLVAMAWLIVPRIRESKATQTVLSSAMAIFWIVVTIWTLVKVQGFASTYFCDDVVRNLGCFDKEAFRFSGYGEAKNPLFTFNDTEMSVDLCRSKCSDQYDFYAAITGSYCTCVMWFEVDLKIDSKECSTSCQGNKNQICGGPGHNGTGDALSVWISKAVGDNSVSQCFIYSTATGLAIVAVVCWIAVTVLVFISSGPAKVPFFDYDRLKSMNKQSPSSEGGAKHDKNWAQLGNE